MTDLPSPARQPRWADALAVAIGTLITLVVSGYQFGRGNHTVYLLEGLRIADPTLFRNDWFVTSTLQYHAVFSWITALLMKLNVLGPAFLAGYLFLAIAWHIAWLKFTQRLGGSRLTYLLSVVLFYLSAAGIALGAYQFLQDGCFLPSNVSTIAMLWGFYFWSIDRKTSSGLCLGFAGMFHLNFAVMAVGIWGALSVWDFVRPAARPAARPATRPATQSHRASRVSWHLLVGSVLLLVPSLFNIIHALREQIRESGSIPLDDFVNIYVRFRHTHHFNPTEWPIALWVAFLWPIPLAIHAWRVRFRDEPSGALAQVARIVAILTALTCVSFLFAGVWFVSESLVQLMFWRFSIYIKLFSCIGAAYVILRLRARVIVLWMIPITLTVLLAMATCVVSPATTAAQAQPRWLDLALRALQDHRAAFFMFAALTFVPALMYTIRLDPRTPAPFVSSLIACVLITMIGWDRWLGWGMTPEAVDAEYLALYHWARETTPVDAVFLIPPSDTAFRLEAHRAIVVNFKHVPQLSGEITHWLDRLTDLIGTRNLDRFPHDYMKLLPALDAQYEQRPPGELIAVARKYDARYIVVDHEWGETFSAQQVYHTPLRTFFVYDRNAGH